MDGVTAFCFVLSAFCFCLSFFSFQLLTFRFSNYGVVSVPISETRRRAKVPVTVTLSLRRPVMTSV